MTRSGADAAGHWSDYWRDARPEVMTLGAAGGARPFEARELWVSFFAGLPDGARVIDLATGGGQVAGYACDAARAHGRRFEVVGVDYAELPPHRGAFQLMGGVRLEQLPFAAASFDAASSQFGIEYADHRSALAELARVLKGGAPAQLLMHHDRSAITEQARVQLAALERVEADGALMRLARQAFRAHQAGQSADRVTAAETAFRNGLNRAHARMGDDPRALTARQYLDFMGDLARRTSAYKPQSALESLARAADANAAWRRRQHSQIRSALDETGIQKFADHARGSGLTVEPFQDMRDDRGALIGWLVRMQREG